MTMTNKYKMTVDLNVLDHLGTPLCLLQGETSLKYSLNQVITP